MLTAAQRARFDEEGWLVIETGLPAAVLDGARSDLEGRYPPSDEPDPLLWNTRLQDAWKTSRNVHRIAVAPAVLDVLRALYHREPRPFQTLNFPVGTSQPAHADSLHFNSTPPSFMCGVWVALEDVHPDAGPVFYYPGSHRLPEFTMADVGVAPTKDGYLDYERFVERAATHFGLHPQTACIRKGQALVWASNLLHGGAPRRDAERTRHSQVTHYYFERCRYYTPMLSRGLEVCWRDPEWIPLQVGD